MKEPRSLRGMGRSLRSGRPGVGLAMIVVMAVTVGCVLGFAGATRAGNSTVPIVENGNRATAQRPVIGQGDQAAVHFTCRLKNGEVVLSTYQNPPEPALKARIYVERDQSTALTITAGKDSAGRVRSQDRGFGEEILYRLSSAVVGLRAGDRQYLEVSAEKVQEKNPDEKIIKLARVRTRPKELRFAPDEYKTKTGRDAEPGRSFIYDPVLPGKVESVSEEEVVVRFAGKEGQEVETPFGKGTIREKPGHFEIEIDARPGALVRSGKFVGRIAVVDDQSITIDYSHPFGGESLVCDVTIESVKPAAEKNVSAEKTVRTER